MGTWVGEDWLIRHWRRSPVNGDEMSLALASRSPWRLEMEFFKALELLRFASDFRVC